MVDDTHETPPPATTPTPTAPIPSEPERSWTAVLSSAELGGPAGNSQWGPWVAQGRVPRPSLPDPRWAEDLALLASLGFGRVVLTLEWTELQPRPGSYDPAAVEAHQERFRLARALGFSPWACLVDGTLPGWFAHDEGGFSDDRARRTLWPRHVAWAAETFDDLAEGWIPQREPIHQVLRCELLGFGPNRSGHRAGQPLGGSRILRTTAEAVTAAVAADAEAVRVLAGAPELALYHTSRLFRPVRRSGHDDGQATGDDGPAGETDTRMASADEWVTWLDTVTRTSWTAAVATGRIDLRDEGGRAHRVPSLRDAVDRIVIQLRPAAHVDHRGSWSPADATFLGEGTLTGFADAVDALDGVTTEITGAADLAPVADDGDAQFEHLATIMDGAAGIGATDWWQAGPIDGWHWERGHGAPTGMIDRDRTPRRVAEQLMRLPMPGR